MKFKTAYSKCRKTSPAGDIWRKKFIRKSDGSLMVSGNENVYESIQQAGLGLGVEDLIRRAKAGDTSAIGEPLDSFIDISDHPTDFLDAHMRLRASEDKFNQLDPALKLKFNNNFDVFLQKVQDGSIKDLFQVHKKSDPVPQVPKTDTSFTPDEITKIKQKILGGTSDA